MRVIAWDTETHRLKRGMAFPRLVCVSWAEGKTSGLMDRAEGYAAVTQWLADPEIILVAHNSAFDLGIICAEAYERSEVEGDRVLGLVRDAYQTGRIHCTEMRQRLLDIAAGVFKFDIDPETGEPKKNSYDLGHTVKRHLGEDRKDVKKGPDAWRLKYATIEHLPISQWPEAARLYPIQDATDTLRVWESQQRYAAEQGSGGEIPDAHRQAETAFCLHLMSGWAARTEESSVLALETELRADAAKRRPELERLGIVRPNGVKDTAKIRALVEAGYAAIGATPPKTKTGQTKTDEETLRASGDPGLEILAEGSKRAKLLNTYIPILKAGTRGPVTSRPNALVDTGRTSWSKPNMQNPPREGGARECFIARPGWVWVAVDYDTIELRALAQRCLEWFGRSEMAEALRRGEDLHLALAAEMLGISYADCVARYNAGDKEVADARQDAKAANFGFPGGMGVKKFLITQRRTVQKKGFTPEQATRWATGLRNAWLRKFPEMKRYFDKIDSVTRTGASCRVKHAWSGRVRGGLDYCSAANGEFQGRTADGAKLAVRRVFWECYLGTGPLRGCRPILFLHDELIIEAPEDRAHEAGEELARVMLEAMREVIPDIPVSAGPVLMRRWWKGAKALRVGGRLVPVKPQKDSQGKLKWVHDGDS